MSEVILDAGVKNILRITRNGAGPDGWAKASKVVYSIFARGLVPSEFFEHTPLEEGGGMVRLTEEGNRVLDAIEMLKRYQP